MDSRAACWLFVGLVCAGLSCELTIGASGLEIKDLDSIKDKEMADVKSWAQLYENINKDLPENGSNEQVFAAARQLRDGKSLFQLKEKSALDLLISLEDAAKSCDMDSYKIVAKNKVISGQRDAKIGTIRNVANICHELHAKTCLAEYRDKYHKIKTDMDGLDRAYVRGTLINVTVDDIGAPSEDQAAEQPSTLPMQIQLMRKPIEFIKDYRSIAKAIAKILKDNDIWYKYQIYLDNETLEAQLPAISPKIVERSLILPCTAYFNHFQSILEPARFDATVDDEGVLKILLDDPEFSEAIVYQKLCKHILLWDERRATKMLQIELSKIREYEFTSKYPLFGLTAHTTRRR